MDKNYLIDDYKAFVPENIFKELVDNAPNAVLILDQGLNLLYCNKNLEDKLCGTENELKCIEDPLSYVMNMNKQQIKDIFNTLIINDQWSGELELVNNGIPLWARVNIAKYIAPDKSVQWILYREDVTSYKMKEKALFNGINFDPVTKLPNMNQLNKMLIYVSKIAKAFPRKKYALICVRADNINYIKDVAGQKQTEKLLQKITEQLKALATTEDALFYTALGEFNFFISRGSADAVMDFIEEVRKLLVQPYRINKVDLYLNPKIGIAIYPDVCDEITKLTCHTKAAISSSNGSMYQKVFQYDRKMADSSTRRAVISQLLYSAIANNEFSLLYQPKFDANTKNVSGAEVLLRWRSQKLGDVPVSEFISVAEEYGQIAEITKWVLRETCRKAVSWKNKGVCDINFAINISAPQIFDPLFIDELRDISEEENYSLDKIDLEITESILMLNNPQARQAIDMLSDKNIKVTIDDFGTGYSSLSYLALLPVCFVKIDRSFVMDIPHNQKNAAIVNAIISMSQSLEIKIIAEGVETEEQYRYLKDAGCDQIQGYYFSKPISADDFEVFMMSKKVKTRNTCKAS